MPRVKANGIDIEYESLGNPKDPSMLLIMGLGAQLITWDDGFCEALAERGFFVIRYDNRDAGLSTKMEHAGPADLIAAYSGHPNPAYSLDDLAEDAVGLLDALRIEKAHIVGASMGGFIAQLVVIHHPERVLSLTSIMSGPGGEDTILPTPDATELLIRPPGPTREDVIELGLVSRELLVGKGNSFDHENERRRIELAYDRMYYPAGLGRQLVASLAAGSRTARLGKVEVPALVVHGQDDPLIPVENGRIVAAAIPGARLIELAGMGHNLPARYWPVVADAIAETVRTATPRLSA